MNTLLGNVCRFDNGLNWRWAMWICVKDISKLSRWDKFKLVSSTFKCGFITLQKTPGGKLPLPTSGITTERRAYSTSRDERRNKNTVLGTVLDIKSESMNVSTSECRHLGLQLLMVYWLTLGLYTADFLTFLHLPLPGRIWDCLSERG